MFLVFIQSPLHLRNWDWIAPVGKQAVVLAEERLKLQTCPAELLERHPVRRISAEDVDACFTDEVEAVVFFAMHPREVPLLLLCGAERRCLPVLAIEESNQLVLNEGKVNNYLLPAHCIMAASEAEKGWMVRQGVPEDRIEVTGWAFHHGSEGQVGIEERLRTRAALGVAGEDRVAVFLPIGFNVCGENREMRRRQMGWCRRLSRGGWTVLAKPHPAEPDDFFSEQVRKFAPGMKIVPARVPVEEVIAASDVVLSRGISQTALQALLMGVPVLKLEMGDVSPLDDLPGRYRMRWWSSIGEAARCARKGQDYFRAAEPVLRKHLPHVPSEARERISGLLGNKFPKGEWTKEDRGRLWLLCCWKNKAAWKNIEPAPSQAVLKRITEQSDFYLQALRALELQDVEGASDPSLLLDAMVETFPGQTQFGAFLEDVKTLTELLIRRGEEKRLEKWEKRLRRDWANEFGVNELLQTMNKERTRNKR